MLENLINTWQTLASNEIRFDDRGILSLKDNGGCGLIHPSCIRPHEESMLQGYIQSCIRDRAWYWSIQQVKGGSRACVGSIGLCNKQTNAAHEVLLTAYLQALAAQRTIAPNTTWKHFKGGECMVKDQACHESVSGLTTDDWLQNDSAQRLYRLEENQEIKLWLNYYKDEKFDYSLAEGSQIVDHGDRVFYICEGIGYARKVDDFLGLVGSEHPQQEGLLRFSEVRA